MVDNHSSGFNLSENKHHWPWTSFGEDEDLVLYKEQDVKEFIRLLKEKLPFCIHEFGKEDRFCVRCRERQIEFEIIDKLAGDELI